MDCIVLAGGRPKPGEPLWERTQGRPKAMLEIAGRPMIAWVLDALRGSRQIGRIVLVGLEEAAALSPGIETVADQGDIVGNLYAGIARLDASSPAAYCWSDIPLATPAMIDRYVEGTADPLLDVNAALVERSRLQARYPAADDLWLRFAEGDFLAADFGIFHPRHALRLRPHIEALAPNRKSALRQALYLGLPVLLRYVTRRLSIPRLERHLERRYAMRCRIRVVQDPELGLDVDTPGNLEVCRRALAPPSAPQWRNNPPV